MRNKQHEPFQLLSLYAGTHDVLIPVQITMAIVADQT